MIALAVALLGVLLAVSTFHGSAPLPRWHAACITTRVTGDEAVAHGAVEAGSQHGVDLPDR
jgi:hypothetical protein